jgi:hypothetical protein
MNTLSSVTISSGDDDEGPKAPAAIIAPLNPALDTSRLPVSAELNSDGTVTLTLLMPEEAVLLYLDPLNGSTIEKPVEGPLVFRRLKGGDLRRLMRADADDGVLPLVAASLGLDIIKTRSIYDALDAVDASAVNDVVNFLSRPGRKTGR